MPTETLIVIAVVLAYFGIFMGVLAYATIAESRPNPRRQPRKSESGSIRVGHHLPAAAEPGAPLPLVAMEHVEVDAARHAMR